MDAFYSSQFDDQSPSFFTPSQAYDYDQPADLAGQVSTQVGNVGLPALDTGLYEVSNMVPSSSLPADVNHGAEMIPQASHFPPHAVTDPYASAGFASQPISTQQHFVPSVGFQSGYDPQHDYTQQTLALQPDYDPQHGYAQQALALQPDSNSQPDDYPQPDYNPQPGYNHQNGYAQQAFAPQLDYNPQPSYDPQQHYNEHPSKDLQED
ncbi:hypothetical protein FS749_012366 [Ceratobasidium sp. UAMH 11750]|nr:hypothetical protein FS749_012366 [Ceratobasidium sp. UAMH 11750]